MRLYKIIPIKAKFLYKNQILKLESNNNPKNDELKKEATNYYINSIQAKLQVLNKISSS